MPTDDEIKRIIKLHEKNYSQGQIAKELDRSKSYINGIFQKLGLAVGVRERSQTKNATERHKTWTRERRLWLNDQFINIVCERIQKEPSNSDLKSLATTYAIMIDKREILEPPTPLKIEDDGFISALESKSEEVFDDIDDNIPLQMDCPKPQAMADPNLVDKELSDQGL